MCYSAQIVQEYERYVRAWGAEIDLASFVRLYRQRQQNPAIRIPKAMDAQFTHARSADAQEIKSLIETFDRQQTLVLEQTLFKQRKRLADAERALQTKSTKAASESRRIAIDKIAWARGKLEDLRRTTLRDDDSRIFPGHYAPVMVWEDGRRIVRPMRYQCRPAGKPTAWDRSYPGTYNARRDNLEGFWKGQFGHSHALVLMSAFYENVSRHRAQGRELAPGEDEQNVVLEFRPQPAQDMLVACLWSHWQGTGNRCFRSPRSPTTHRRKSLPPGTTAAWCRSGRRTSMTGWMPAAPIRPACTRSSTTGNARITSTGWPPDRGPVSGGFARCPRSQRAAGGQSIEQPTLLIACVSAGYAL